MKKINQIRYLLIVLPLVLIIILCSACSSGPKYIRTTTVYPAIPGNTTVYTQSVQYTPVDPSGLSVNEVSYRRVRLSWIDNSTNEQGFKVYCNGSMIAELDANTNSFSDISLNPAAEYNFSVTAYNSIGESGAATCYIKTPNPSVVIKLDRIGVYDNRENFLRGNGDIYLLIGVNDGDSQVEYRIPSREGDTISLAKNETIAIGSTIFSSQEVGDLLNIIIVGYESDGGSFEQLAYQALGMTMESSIGIGAGLLEMYNMSLGGLLASFFGAEDDWLGAYENSWTVNNNWGAGSYKDIVCYDERGEACLRLWFTIEIR